MMKKTTLLKFSVGNNTINLFNKEHYLTDYFFVFYDLQPEQYLSHLIGHEGKGSILSELKSRGWCNSLLAGHSTSARGFGFFDIMVDLTEEGFENVDEVTKIIFQVINIQEKKKTSDNNFSHCHR